MMQRLARLPHELGGLGLASLLLLALVAGFHFVVLKPLEARDASLKERLARQVPRAEPAGSGNLADKVAALYDFLRKEEQTTDWLAKLHGIGSATGVQLRSASYRTQKTEGQIARYEIVVPLAGSYPQIRDFVQRALAEIPVMSLDQLTLKRENRNEGELRGELRLTLHTVKP